MDTTGTYPHNGLSGLCFDLKGNFVFGLGENLGHAYTMIGRDGRKIEGAKGIGGGVFAVQPKAINLSKSPAGFGIRSAFASIHGAESLLSTTTPDTVLPADCCTWCRTVITVTVTNTDAPASIRHRLERRTRHPAHGARHWRSALRGHPLQFPTFPRNTAADCWSPPGRSSGGKLHPQTQRRLGDRLHGALIQGGDSFRPVGLAMAPDGSLYASDWGSSSYNLNY